MNQQKIGEFLKNLRKSKGLTQEQLAEHFYVSSRTVSRWETGSNMPDLDILLKLAEFYDVDVREIIDGERKSENMENKDIKSETNDAIKKAAEYARLKKLLRCTKLHLFLLIFIGISLVFEMLFSQGYVGLLYETIPENIYRNIHHIVSKILDIPLTILSILALLEITGIMDKVIGKIKQKKNNN